MKIHQIKTHSTHKPKGRRRPQDAGDVPLEETQYLLESPANAARLRTAMENLEAGKGVARALQDEPN